MLDCGLYWRGPSGGPSGLKRLPLLSVRVAACMVETVAEVMVVQSFFNENAFPVEALYVFPLDSNAAVHEFEAHVQGRTIRGVVREKQHARRIYTAATRKGQGAFLLEQDSGDIFKASLGNVPPHAEARVIIKYVAELRTEQGKTCFVLPTAVAPRFAPSGTPEAPRSTVGTEESYFTLDLTCHSSSGFSSLASPSHKIAIETTGLGATVRLGRGSEGLGADFVLYAEPHQAYQPKVVVEQEPRDGLHAAMISFFPRLEFQEAKCELVFLVDRSGSMSSKVTELREALTLFLRSLPPDCLFNIISFGTSHSSLFPSSVRLDGDSLQAALDHVRSMQADMGGTNLLFPLQSIQGMAQTEGYPRQLLVLTDGQISNTSEAVGLAARLGCSVYALGLGESVSHELVDGLAHAGRGVSYFVVPGERMDAKVIHLLQHATQPALRDVELNWGGEGAVGGRAPGPEQQVPRVVPPLHSGQHFRVFAYLPSMPREVSISATSPDGRHVSTLQVEPGNIVQGSLLQVLAARCKIRDLEEHSSTQRGDLARKAIIDIAKANGLASRFTSFVAVEEGAPADDTEEAEEVLLGSPEDGDEILRLLRSNMELIMSRGDMLSDLSVQSECLAIESRAFYKASRQRSWTQYLPDLSFLRFWDRSPAPAAPPPSTATAPPPSTATTPPPATANAPGKKRSLAAEALLPSRPPLGPRERMAQILAFQDFRGPFQWSGALFALMGLEEAQLRGFMGACAELSSLQCSQADREQLCATLVAIAYLRVWLKALQSEWGLAVSKAERWAAPLLQQPGYDLALKAAAELVAGAARE